MNRLRRAKRYVAPASDIVWRIVLTIAIPAGTALPQTHHSLPTDTLAVVGTEVITVERFTQLYKDKLIRVGLTDNGETRQGYLRNLVEEDILIAVARMNRLDHTKEAAAELARMRLQELLNAYSQKHISASLTVTDEDLRTLFAKMNTRLKVRHLYARTKAAADSLFDELSRGRSFEELARSVFADSRLRASGGSLGYVGFDEMDPAFERVAFAMKVGEVSRPVKTVQGYSIIRVDDIQYNPLLSENEFLKSKERLIRFARKQKFEEASAEHTAQLRTRLQVRFNDTLIDRLYQLTQQHSLRSLLENRTFSLAADDLDAPAVSSTMGEWSTRHLIKVLGETPEGQRQWIRSNEDFKEFIAGLVIRSWIARRAGQERMDTSSSFRRNVRYSFDTYLLKTVEDQLRKQIVISRDSLNSYYLRSKDKFMTPPERRLSAILLDNPSLVDSVKRSLEKRIPFDTLAKRFSIQRATAEVGGDLGFYREKDLGALGHEVFALHPGEWTGPLVDDGKYLFVQCTARGESIERSFEECSKEIQEILIDRAWQEKKSQFVESWRKRLDCRMFPERLMAISLK